MRILKNIAYIAVLTLCAYGLILGLYMIIIAVSPDLPENKPFIFLISIVPAAALTIGARLLSNRLDSNFYLYVPMGFLLVGIFQLASPASASGEMFHWFYQMILSFGAFIWTILYSIKDFIHAIIKNKKLLKEISEEHEKQLIEDKGED